LPIRYNKPSAISFDSDTTISLVVEMAGAGSAKPVFEELPGGQEATTVKLSNRVVAKLVGPPDQVSITQADPPEERPLMDGTNAQWIWNVRAKQPGKTTLTLEIYAVIQPGGDANTYQMKTYTNSFPVQISWLSQLKWEIDQIDPVWKWLGFGTPVAIACGVIAFFRKSIFKRKPGGPARSDSLR